MLVCACSIYMNVYIYMVYTQKCYIYVHSCQADINALFYLAHVLRHGALRGA